MKHYSGICYPLVFTVILLTVFTPSTAQQQRNLLGSFLKDNTIRHITETNYTPYRKDSVTIYLKNLPAEIRKKIITEGEEAMRYDWPAIPATAYLDFKRTGDREVMQQYSRKRSASLKKLILAELLEDQGRFMDALVNGSWAICEQSTWVLSAHLPAQKGGAGIPNVNEPVIDLGAGEIANLLGWAYYFFRDDFATISPFLQKRIPQEIKSRIITPYLERDDFWWQAFKKDGFVNNWNPWCNYNVLISSLLLGPSLDEDTKYEVITKSMHSVDKFINYYKDDGACEEGPAYWDHAGGKMMEYLELLQKISSDKIYIGNQPLIANMGKYIMNAHIAGDWFVNFADSPARLNADAGIIYRYGNYLRDTDLKKFGAFIADQNNFFSEPLDHSLDRALHNLFNYNNIRNTPTEKENTLYLWYPQTQIAGGRTDKNAQKGFFFAAKGGYNDESHNHNDAGSFMLFHNGTPLLVDIGVETYTRKTFSSERYTIWTMQSDYHNLPRVNGTSQSFGKQYKAAAVDFENTRSGLRFTLDIASAYPIDAKCTSWKRTYHLQRSSAPELRIKDSFSLRSFRDYNTLHFITTLPPVTGKDGKIILKTEKNREVSLYFPQDTFDVTVEELPLEDPRLLRSWQQKQLYRIVLRAKEKTLQGNWKCIIKEEKL
ncbi:Heparinase II/III-like protein [Sinomicrobium oceani]|uniref:Heparinase II/III-like protein n=1 Tax=Sinomicrobium oceani TaxID=1150368 RepID=A0A1K1MXT2_9FLAO|nr:heparinase II/III family protein [Sinomicrobium oceani]SFW27984.1 Heparinase II/III-like protein [Sinomicrobium oceani]